MPNTDLIRLSIRRRTSITNLLLFIRRVAQEIDILCLFGATIFRKIVENFEDKYYERKVRGANALFVQNGVAVSAPYERALRDIVVQRSYQYARIKPGRVEGHHQSSQFLHTILEQLPRSLVQGVLPLACHSYGLQGRGPRRRLRE